MNGINLNQWVNEPGSSLKVPSFTAGISQVLEGPILFFTRVPFHTQLALPRRLGKVNELCLVP